MANVSTKEAKNMRDVFKLEHTKSIYTEHDLATMRYNRQISRKLRKRRLQKNAKLVNLDIPNIIYVLAHGGLQRISHLNNTSLGSKYRYINGIPRSRIN